MLLYFYFKIKCKHLIKRNHILIEKDVPLQKFLKWSDSIEKNATDFIKKFLKNEKFLGIHIRNGVDFVSYTKYFLNLFRNFLDFILILTNSIEYVSMHAKKLAILVIFFHRLNA